jgi:branched-chain amino acid transport system substrate-binding protein
MRLGLAGAAAVGLTACGAQTPPGQIPKPKLAAEFDNDMASFIKQQFGGPHSGAGLSYEFAAGLLLSTSQAPYGEASLKGINLALKHIKMAGGPNFSIGVKDFAASSTAGATAMTAWGQINTPYCISCGFFDEGNIVKPAIQYKVFTTDPGGGDLPVFQALPYIWGTRAITPSDGYGGVMKYLAAKAPHKTRFALAGSDLGPLAGQFTTVLQQAMKDYFPAAQIVAQEYTEVSGSGSYDFGPAMSKLTGVNPDVIFPFTWGTDPASFMKSYYSTDLTATVIGPDYFATSTPLSGNAILGYQFAYDYFNPDDPGNTWGKMFSQAYEAEYGEVPNYYPANYYENTFFLWQLMSRVLSKGGNPHDSTQLQAALVEQPTLKSVYGTGNGTGSISWNPKTHTPSSRPMGLFEVTTTSTTAQPKQLARFSIGGTDFSVL